MGRHSPSLPSWWCVGLQMDCPVARHSYRGGVWDYSWTVPSPFTPIVVVCGTVHGLSHRTSLVSWWCLGLFMDCLIARHAYRGGVWDYSWTVPSHVTRIVVVCGTIHGLSHRMSLVSWWCVGLFMDCPTPIVVVCGTVHRLSHRMSLVSSWCVGLFMDCPTPIVVVCGTIHGLSRRPSLQSWWCVGLQADCPIAHRSNRGGVWNYSWTVPYRTSLSL